MAPAVAVPRRWLSEDMKNFVPVHGEPVRLIDPDKVDCIATASVRMPDGDYSAVLVIADGERFLTILTADEERALADAVSSNRGFLQFDSRNGAVRVEGIRFFEDQREILIDSSRVTRLYDGLRQHNDFIRFEVVFANNCALGICANDADFDSNEIIKGFAPPREGETAREAFFREADEGTAISRAAENRVARHRQVLNAFTEVLAASAPQLYRVEGTSNAYFTRPEDVQELFVFTVQTDAARIEYKPHVGSEYGMPVSDTIYFKSPDDAVRGAAALRQEMNGGGPVPPERQPEP